MAQGTKVKKRDCTEMEYDEILKAIDDYDIAKLQQIVTANEIDVNVNFEWTPLLAAVCCRSLTIVQLLLSIGADPNIGDDHTNYPLHFAVFYGDLNMVELLCSSGATVDCKSWRSWTPLHRAAYEGHERIADFLLCEGANMYSKDHNSLTPLHQAVYQNHHCVVHLLVVTWKMDISQLDKIFQSQVKKMIHQSQSICKSKTGGDSSQVEMKKDEVGLKAVASYQKATKKGTCASNQFKLVVLGPEGAGKTSTTHTLIDEEFQPDQPSTIGTDISSCKIGCHHVSKWKKVKVLAEIKKLPKRYNTEVKVNMSLFSADPSLPLPPKESVPKELYTTVRKALSSNVIFDGDIRMVLLDIGGQEIYYEIHFMFLVPEDIALLVFDASKGLHEPVISRQRSKRFQEKIATRGMQSNIQAIEHTLQSIYCHCGRPALKGSLSPRSPTVLMVGTHAENLTEVEQQSIIQTIRRYFDGKPFLEHLPRLNTHAFHFISNKVRRKAVINHLKSTILEGVHIVIKSQCPISYLKFEQQLLEASYKVRLTRAEALCMGANAGLEGDDVDPALLHYMKKGIILYYPEIESLKDEIFISPQEVSDLLSTVITTQSYEPDTANLQRACKRYEDFALLEEALFDWILSKSIPDRSSDKDVIIGLLKKFSLAAEVPTSTKFDDEGPSILPQSGGVFFVPSLLVYDIRNVYEKKPGDIAVLFYFPDKVLPESIFNQLLVKTINWCCTEGHCIGRIYHGTGYFAFQKGAWQQFQLQYNQAVSSIDCFITIHPHNPPEEKQTVLLAERKALLEHLQVALNTICNSHMPMVGKPVTYLACPLNHEESASQPHLLLDSIDGESPVMCRYKRKEATRIPPECYIQLFKSQVPNQPSRENQLFTIFKRHYPQLLLLTDYNHLSPYCVSKGIISVDDDERISNAITKTDKVRVVLTIMSQHLKANYDNSFVSLLGIMEAYGNLCTKQLAELIKSEIQS